MTKNTAVNLIIPKGRIQAKVLDLLARIGISVSMDGRNYRPGSTDSELSIKLLKPQNIPKLVELQRHDCGFTGYDWVVEQDADVVEVLDLGYDPVKLIAAVPEELAEEEAWRRRRLVVASEYSNLAGKFITRENLKAVFLQTYGATEALPPEDADLIVDNTATGATLRRNRLQVVSTIMRSSTRFVCNRNALSDPFKRRKIEDIATLMKSALLADSRVLLEMNVAGDRLERVIDILPCMRSPTVSTLHAEQGYAVKAAVPARDTHNLLLKLREAGARDILEYKLEKIVNGDEPVLEGI
jgi:ATP phosphoribosyltransferase